MKTGQIVKRYNSFKASMSCQLVRLFYMLTSTLACIALQLDHKASSSTLPLIHVASLIK